MTNVKRRLVILVLALFTGITSCKSPVNDGNNTVTPDNSRTSLDWAGAYRGTLPCDDCEGIETVIHLYSSGSYLIQIKYAGKSDSVYRSSGNFVWDDRGGKITLKDENDKSAQYLVGENMLIKLDQRGTRISGPLADRYKLEKVTPEITERYWKLTELNGKPVTREISYGKEPHMILKAEGNRVQGHGGCNGFGGAYELKGDNGIGFSGIISTKMACQQMETETRFFEVLQSVDSYQIKSDTLWLKESDMAAVARFETVYLK